MNSRGRQKAGNRRVVLVHAAVGEDEDGVSLFYRLGGLAAQPVHSLFQPAYLFGVEQRGECLGGYAVDVYFAYLLKLGVGQERLLDAELAAVFGGFVEQVQFAAYHGAGGGDQFLAYRVERRVGDLGEALPEVVEQDGRLVGHDRERHVGAHRTHRVGAGHRHRLQNHAEVFQRVAESRLPTGERVEVRAMNAGRLRQVVERDHVLGQPVAVWATRRQRVLEILVLDYLAALGVQHEHPARVYALLVEDVFGRDVQHAGLGTHHQQVVGSDQIATRAQAVAVEDGAYLGAVGTYDQRGAVPGFHHGRMVFVEVALLLVHGDVVAPGFGNQHHHRVFE